MADADGVTVGLRTHHAGDPNGPAGPRDIFDDDRLAERGPHAFTQKACDCIGRPAYSGRHDDRDRARRIGLCCRAHAACCKQTERDKKIFHLAPSVKRVARDHGRSEISLVHSGSAQARTVRVRTLPSEAVASANLATLSPLGASAIRRRSLSPEVMKICLISTPSFLAS